MQLRRRNLFTTIRTEGAILPADLLQRINDRDAQIKGLSPEDYHLAGSLKVNEAINQSYNRMLSAWAAFQTTLQNLPVTDVGTTVTREKWLLPLFQELGYGRLPKTDAIEVEGKAYPISHMWQNTPIHLVSAKVKLDERKEGVAGAARVSPHGLVQELLNRSDAHLWGFVSNGLQLRILRDNVSLTRQAYVEFDLEAMMNGELYADFALLWLLCHESRVNAEKPQDCWLETWSKAAHEQGVSALKELGKGVEAAIKALGRGFISHSANKDLLGKLRDGSLDKQEYYRQLLRLVYRLLFLFVAEDRTYKMADGRERSLIFVPDADDLACERYGCYYSLSRLRRLAERRIGTRHSDLYQSLRLVMQKLGNGGCRELGLPALGSFLFSNEAIADLNTCEVANHDLLEAIRALAFIHDPHGLRIVDYKTRRSEELGSVYEALLELHPIINAEARHFDLDSASGNERKTTGSYYTPDSLVQCLLDSALDPVVAEAIKQPDAEAALLRLKVVDPACGSGHFLIAAAHRIAKHLASVRTGDGEPAPEATRKALRDVIGHCIYGVDMNPMAVELCKVSLWMEALEPGKPLTFLEHRIQWGNALIGATPALMRKGIPDEAFKPIEGDDKEVCAEYKRINKNERLKQQDLFVSPREPWEMWGNLAVGLMGLEEIGDDEIADIRRKQERWEQLVRSSDYLNSGFLANAWCAAFVWKKNRDLPYPITEEVFRKIEKSPYNYATGHNGTWLEKEVNRLAEQYQFFHWHLAFPNVFRVPMKGEIPENEQVGWNGGFDVVLGNPPWERIKLQEKEWFAGRRPDIANASNAAARKRLIEALRTEDSLLFKEFQEALRQAEGESHLLRDSGCYPLCGRGDINLFAIFAECMRSLLSVIGRVGCVLPPGIATDDSNKLFIQKLVTSKVVVSFFDFTNRGYIFPSTESTFSFCLFTFANKSQSDFTVAGQLWQVEHLLDEGRAYKLTQDDILHINPNTLTLPIFRSLKDATLNLKIHSRVPILIQENVVKSNSWDISFSAMFHMANDSGLFRTHKQLLGEGLHLEGNIFRSINTEIVPLYESKLVVMFNHRAATFDGIPEKDLFGTRAGTLKPKLEEMIDPTWVPIPRYWVAKSRVEERVPQFWRRDWLIGFRNAISAVADARSVSFTIFPRFGAGHSMPLLFSPVSVSRISLLLANFNSFVLDYVAKQKASGGNLTFYIVKQLPLLSPNVYIQRCFWCNASKTLQDWLLPRVLELTYTSHDLKGFATDCGYKDAPFIWDEDRRSVLRAELDAAYFHLYGIERDDASYILDAFPVVRRKDEAQYNEYRTKRVILEIYDAMQQAIATGQPYQTLLDPPPANGWTPAESRDEGGGMRDEGQTATASTDEVFQLQMQDARPQPTLFDLAQ